MLMVWLLSGSVPTAYSVACIMTFDLPREALRKEFLLIAQRSKPGYSPGVTRWIRRDLRTQRESRAS